MNEALAPLIAIVGPDGAGKSTLAADIAARLGAGRAIAHIYLGLGSGDLARRIKRWPLIGPAIELSINARADRARDTSGRIPGLFTALVIYAFSLRRMRSFERMMRLRRRGVTVITDRYPQIEVPGYYDGPGLSAAATASPLIAWLARRELRLYERMAAHLPTLVIRLNIDVATALARQPDHNSTLVALKIAATPLLLFSGAALADVDATRPYPEVRAEVLALVEGALHGPAPVSRGAASG
ncbi:MAG: nucleoside triphosphate hydrolase [Sphingomonas sp.]